MTYNVFGGTLSLALSIYLPSCRLTMSCPIHEGVLCDRSNFLYRSQFMTVSNVDCAVGKCISHLLLLAQLYGCCNISHLMVVVIIKRSEQNTLTHP